MSRSAAPASSPRRLILLAALMGAASGCAAPRALHVVIAPVADLRAKSGTWPAPGTHDPFQETQLLYGEPVQLVTIEGGWAHVEAVEQPEYTHHRRWQGYPGWVLYDLLQPIRRRPTPNAVVTVKWMTVWENPNAMASMLQLPMGTKVTVAPTGSEFWKVQLLSGATGWISRGAVAFLEELDRLPESARRERIIRLAEQLIGDPYFWGGRSPYAGAASPMATGVDCSGLVNLAYRTAGLSIPRDSHEQRLKARAVASPEAADLIFLSEQDRPSKIVHVMLYAGEGWLIEGPGTGSAVRRIRVVDRFGLALEELHPGGQVERQTIWFGTYW